MFPLYMNFEVPWKSLIPEDSPRNTSVLGQPESGLMNGGAGILPLCELIKGQSYL